MSYDPDAFKLLTISNISLTIEVQTKLVSFSSFLVPKVKELPCGSPSIKRTLKPLES